MKLPRRKFLHLAAGAAALPFAPHIARAQAYPSRPVRWIVGFPPAEQPTSPLASLANGCRNGSVSPLSLRTVPVPAAISALKRS